MSSVQHFTSCWAMAARFANALRTWTALNFRVAICSSKTWMSSTSVQASSSALKTPDERRKVSVSLGGGTVWSIRHPTGILAYCSARFCAARSFHGGVGVRVVIPDSIIGSSVEQPRSEVVSK
ncbi:amidase signature enzyme [Colletotrichum scovillei]|uniref:Amidase signature enzyme n=1 Tax=Colletotrichum scovillei TaxID=1209932 RepID=A0A9P7R6Z9_9PEZI|nr:amidase signature enzyme [Colletotrichum scovillei]KAG7070350.1 amidase signature enzyme [Colletotrichum scovillei]KAG7078598.1 amidase signature enzyme [Colletotrichum scovillei]